LCLQFIQKRGRTSKQKDVSYITPYGEEIRSKQQLEKYLKGHPGGPTAIDFDWTSGALFMNDEVSSKNCFLSAYPF
jgi:hypothetical protein